MLSNMFWNILGVAIVIGFVIFSGLDWYWALPIGIVVALLVVFFGGYLLGKSGRSSRF
tara:strand:- start:231 stop:404 length:174 start_codon:yes stop_codon:yes gene_type:complete